MTVEFKHGRCEVPGSLSETQPGCVVQWLGEVVTWCKLHILSALVYHAQNSYLSSTRSTVYSDLSTREANQKQKLLVPQKCTV